jgi:hypothetical protein
LVIEEFDEVVEAGLLLKEVGSGRLGGFFARGQHAPIGVQQAIVSGLLFRTASGSHP